VEENVHHVLTVYPFLLPNLVAAVLCLASATMVQFTLTETLQERRSPKDVPYDSYMVIRSALLRTLAWLCRWNGIAVTSEKITVSTKQGEKQSLLLTTKSDATVTPDVPLTKEGILQQQQSQSIWSRPMTRRHLLIHWAFAFVSTLSDEAFPLFAMSVAGGLGMPEATIGSILSLAGLVFASFQYLVYHVIVDRCGIYNALVVGSIMGIQPLFLIPISLIMPSRLTASIFLAVIMGICKVFVSHYLTTISLPLNKLVPPPPKEPQ
jgi:hypothetical protein